MVCGVEIKLFEELSILTEIEMGLFMVLGNKFPYKKVAQIFGDF